MILRPRGKVALVTGASRRQGPVLLLLRLAAQEPMSSLHGETMTGQLPPQDLTDRNLVDDPRPKHSLIPEIDPLEPDASCDC
jgi:hypothetical protein